MILLLLAQATAPVAESGWLEMILLSLVGMGVVFAALAIIGGAMGLLSAVLSRQSAPEAVPVPVAVAPPAPVATGAADPRTLAVLSAAAVAAVGRPVRVKRVTFINETTVSGWKEAGRVAVQSSHNLRRSL